MGDARVGVGRGDNGDRHGARARPRIVGDRSDAPGYYRPRGRYRCLRSSFALLVIVALLVGLTGCRFTKSAFANEADKAGSQFAAAAATLDYLHDGKLTRAYAKASFVSYEQNLQGLAERLSAASGAPEEAELQSLLQAVRPAEAAVSDPCLDPTCDWASQLAALGQASDALLKAAGEA